MKKALMLLWLFGFGGALYFAVEMIWRGCSHPAMIVVGGLCFVLIGLINELLTYDMSILLQGIIATAAVLLVELLSGILLNIVLQLNIWDYSNLPFNLLGQICLYFSGLWYILSLVGIVLDDYLRYWIFGEQKPRYKI